MALQQHPRVVGERRHQRGRHVGGGARELDPQRGALARGLHDDREVQPLLDRGQRLGGAQLAERRLVEGEELGRRDAGVQQQVLGEHLVHRARAGQDAGARVGHAEDLQQLLHGAVLAVAAVEGHERDLGRLVAQPADQVEAHVDAHHLVAQPLERVLHARARAQRHLALERAAALEDRDPAHCASGAPPRRPGSRQLDHRAAGLLLGSGAPACSRRRTRPALAGERAVERHLLLDHLADPADALADPLLVRAGEVQPHRVVPAPVEEGRRARHERHVVAQRAGEQVGGVDEVGQRGPDEQPAAGARPLRLLREVLRERVEHRVAPAAVDAR